MKKKNKKRSATNNSQKTELESEALVKAPHSFIIHRGNVGSYIQQLTRDVRKVMEPFTASSLKVRRRNTIKDFVAVSGVLHVSHLCIFTHTEIGTYLKIARLPRGPTLSFRVHNYCLSRDVRSNLKKQFVFEEQFKHAPLLVLNSFSGEGMHMKLMASMFQNMFPTINITKVNIGNIRRIVLLNYNPTSKLIDFRHYAIRPVPVGVSKGVGKIVQSKVPDLSRYEEISEFLSKPGHLSESEFEDDPASHIILPQKLPSRGNIAGRKSAIRLIELGPRLTLQLIKVENGLLDGEVLFHEHIHKTDEDLLQMKKNREAKAKLKANRTRIQEENKKKKEKLKELQKQQSLKGMKKKSESDTLMQRAVKEANEAGPSNEEDIADDEWYRQEVGEEPEKDLFDAKSHLGTTRKAPYGAHLRKMKKLEKSTDLATKNKHKFSKKGGSRKDKDSFDRKSNKQGKKVLGGKVSKRR